MEEATYTYYPGMYEEMFGLGFLTLLIGSTLYAVGRTIYERWIKKVHPDVDHAPTGIPFPVAVRLANEAFKVRFNRERDTQVIVLPRNADGTITCPEPAVNPGARTVDVQDRSTTGRHRSIGYIGHAPVVSRVPEPA